MDTVGQRASSIPALASFSEVVKLAIATELDIDPEELRMGRQKYRARVGEAEIETEQIFLADKLENGAGYTNWASRWENFERALYFVYGNGGALENGATLIMSDCDQSCPDCLRSYANISARIIGLAFSVRSGRFSNGKIQT